jgi:Uma2 family endonuclease
MTQTRWTVEMLNAMPTEEGKRYEIIDGELHVTTQPHFNHQRLSARFAQVLLNWCIPEGLGDVIPAPGIIFDPANGVAPDVVWVSAANMPLIMGANGKLFAAPDLVIEILSPGNANQTRDRVDKLNLYSGRGVGEYWIASWQERFIEVYRRASASAPLTLAGTLQADDTLTSPLLPGFSCPLQSLFNGLN